MQSWKTTICGVLYLAGAALVYFGQSEVGQALMGVAGAGGFVVARDH